MRQVLMPVDEGPERLDRQLEALHDLFNHDEVAVTILYVHKEIQAEPDEAGKTTIDFINENLEEIQGIPETIGRAATTLNDDDIPVEVMESRGDEVHTAILDVAGDVDADVIITATRKRSPVGKAVFGSVTQGVILEGDLPVVVA